VGKWCPDRTFDHVGDPLLLGIVAVIAALDFVGDKIPIVDHQAPRKVINLRLDHEHREDVSASNDRVGHVSIIGREGRYLESGSGQIESGLRRHVETVNVGQATQLQKRITGIRDVSFRALASQGRGRLRRILESYDE
jgi:hypothetical protein